MQIASETLGWDKVETRFPLEGKLQFDNGAGAGVGGGGAPNAANGKLSPVMAVLAVLTADALPDVVIGKEKELIFPQDIAIKDASLILMREKNSKPTLVRVSLTVLRRS